ncbi:NADH-quinone oxidoreductase subunit C [Streptomyces sp. ODS28]|uniref:NADH-quinone oxidoreductase subunit C n=1 Tax=Streptomyces sp. ODS28 TaxID=3136688 RepID=UPI0031EE4402
MTGTDEPNETGAGAAPEGAGAGAEAAAAAGAEETAAAEAAPSAPVGWLPRPAEEIFGAGATAEEAYGLLTADVPADGWLNALTAARDDLGCTFFDWLSAVDEPGTGFRVCAHVVALPGAPGGTVRRLVLRTTVPHEDPRLPTATGVYAGASWHERETHEMFGIGFDEHPNLVPLLLPEAFEGHPLRKDFVLAARVAKAWPGAKEPGESGHGGPKRRQMLPPGVPDPNEWGPLKGQLPPVPSRPARGRGRAESASGERPARRTRTAGAGSASQNAEAPATTESPATTEGAADTGTERPRRTERPARRNRSVSAGSASQRAEQQAPPEQPEEKPQEAKPQPEAEPQPEESAAPAPRSTDAPWHHARPAFDAEQGEQAEQTGQGEGAEQTGERTENTSDSSDTSDTSDSSTEERTDERRDDA